MEIYREVKMRPPERPAFVAWIIRILILFALLLVYFLSVPPLVFGTLVPNNERPGQSGPKMQSPSWVQFYVVPYNWAVSNSFLRKPLDYYSDWCVDMMQR
jgi:hypothetical protein